MRAGAARGRRRAGDAVAGPRGAGERRSDLRLHGDKRAGPTVGIIDHQVVVVQIESGVWYRAAVERERFGEQDFICAAEDARRDERSDVDGFQMLRRAEIGCGVGVDGQLAATVGIQVLDAGRDGHGRVDGIGLRAACVPPPAARARAGSDR